MGDILNSKLRIKNSKLFIMLYIPFKIPIPNTLALIALSPVLLYRRYKRGFSFMRITARRCNPVIRRFAQRLEAEGKVFKVVITACMRKLLIILNTMIRNQALWTEEIILKNP